MARKGSPSSSKWTSTESRVVPGRSETIIRSAWAKVLMNVDLPVLGRPTTAIFMTASAGFSSSPLGNFLVEWHQLVADVHHEEDQAGLVHCRINLPVHLLAQIVTVNHADAAGIDQLQEPRILIVAELDECSHSIAGDARQVIDDCDPSPRQPVQKRRLADIGSTHD